MVYEVYVDELLLVQFFLNFYMLLLLKHCTHATATVRRMVFGAFMGSVLFVITLCGNRAVLIRGFCGTVFTNLIMLAYVYPVKGFRNYLNLLKRALIVSVGIGGITVLAARFSVYGGNLFLRLLPVLIVFGIILGIVKEIVDRKKNLTEQCMVNLKCGEVFVEALAIWDSGNSLREPISGAPVCVVSREVLGKLKEGGLAGFRVIPYRCIDEAKGIMEGYLLPQMEIIQGGFVKKFQDIYIAVAPKDGCLKSVDVLLNPFLLQNKYDRQKGNRNDNKSIHAGKNSVQNGSERQYFFPENRGDSLHRRGGDTACTVRGGTGVPGDL